MKIYKWCKTDWLRTHQLFCRPGDIVFVEGEQFKVMSMPYKGKNGKDYTIDLEIIVSN